MSMNRSRYPANWDAIALSVKSNANWECEQCGRPCRKPGESDAVLIARIKADTEWAPDLYDENLNLKLVRFTLTTAHLNHIPEDCKESNLSALCSVCHCRFDLKAMPRKKMLLREYQGQLRLFD